MQKNELLSITVNREADEIVYRVKRSNELANEELEYYLEEIIQGICTWKPDVCKETPQNYNGTIRKRKTNK